MAQNQTTAVIKKHDYTLRDFDGVNTQAARQAIGDNEFAWLENIQPIGHGNLRSVGAPTDVGITLGATCYSMKEADINAHDYMIMFCTDGSAYSIDLAAPAIVTIGTAGTFSGSGTTFDNWNDTRIIIADPTKGVFSWDATTLVNMSSAFAITAKIDNGSGGAGTTLTVTVTAGYLLPGQVITGATVAANTLILSQVTGTTGGTGTYTVNNSQNIVSEAMTATPSCPANGQCVATYAGRVWVSKGRAITFSAPNSFSDFTTTNFGGSFSIQDSTLHSDITQLVSASGFLYVVGSDSVNVISDVRVSTSPATTLFSNLNLVTTAGTVSPASVIPYYRTLWMASPFGFIAVTGANAQKGSDKLDGIYSLLANYNNISGGVAVINQILCLCFLVSYKDPVAGTRPLFAIYFNKKWYFASQRSDITFCATASVDGDQVMYATNGTKLYKCFRDTATNIAQIVQTKLWNFGEEAIADTQTLKCGVECVMPLVSGAVNVTIDTEIASTNANLANSNTVTWINASAVTVTWVNNASVVVTWIAAGFVWFRGDVSNVGKYTGMTITTSVPSIELSAAQLQYELRARW